MGKLDDYSLDQMAGALALVISSIGGLLLILFKSRCSHIKVCWGLWDCIRVLPDDSEDEDDSKKKNKKVLTKKDKPQTIEPEPEADATAP
tara:strand:+ start:1892 stop:2161 length:270 start_codon:yes stop_codon:yes gene_type:complete